MKKYFIVIPVYNEEKQIVKLIDSVHKYCSNIIVVNDGSKDKTLDNIKNQKAKIKTTNQNANIFIIHKKQNSGKGAAMKSGAKRAWEHGAKGIIFVDGDGQHDPRHLPDFYQLLDKNDIVIGIRKLKAKIPFYRRLGNELFILLVRLFFHINIEDVICGYRGFSKKGYKAVDWKSKDYGVEAEMMTIIGRKKLEYKTTVVDTIYHDKYKGFSILDGFKILLTLPYWKFRKLS